MPEEYDFNKYEIIEDLNADMISFPGNLEHITVRDK